VARGRIDLAVVTPPARAPAGVRLRHLLDDPLFVAVPRAHRLAGRASVPPGDLAGERWIAGSAEPDSPLLGTWSGAAVRPEVGFVVRDWMAKLGLVAAGHGVTVVPGLAVPALPPDIVVVRIDDPAASRPTAVARREAAATDHVDAFVEALRDIAATLAAEVRHRIQAAAPERRSR
jgi:DNA-binding transcriptional LysR family regulator